MTIMLRIFRRFVAYQLKMKKMKLFNLFLLIAIVGLSSCGSPEMDPSTVKAMTLGYDKGIVAGIDVGDNWEDVKENLHKDWETEDGKHFMKKWDEMNFMVLNIDLNSDNKVRQLSMTISGKSGNLLLIEELKSDLTKEYNDKYEVKKQGTSWGFVAKNDDPCNVLMNFIEGDNGSKTLSVSVMNLSF